MTIRRVGVRLLSTFAAVVTCWVVACVAPAGAEPGRVVPAEPVVGRWPALVVGMGDSVPAGNACGCANYVTLLGQALGAGDGGADGGGPAGASTDGARVRSYATGGLTTAGALAQLAHPDVRAALSAASLVVITVGANDFSKAPLADPKCRPAVPACYRGPLLALATRLDRLYAAVETLAAPGGGRVLVTGYWNVFLDGAVGRAHGAAYVTGSDALTRAVNGVAAAAARRAGVTYVDIYQPLKGAGDLDCTWLLASDGDHPNARGHQVIADALLGALEATQQG